MKTYGMGSGNTAPPFLTSTLDGGEQSASLAGSQVDLRAGLDALKRRNIHCPFQESKLNGRSPSLYRLSYLTSFKDIISI
jgi:hypothetical protein